MHRLDTASPQPVRRRSTPQPRKGEALGALPFYSTAALVTRTPPGHEIGVVGQFDQRARPSWTCATSKFVSQTYSDPSVSTLNSSRTALLPGIVGRSPWRAGSRGAEGVQGVVTEEDRRPARHRKRQVAPPTQPEERSLYTSDGRINPEVMASVAKYHEIGKTSRTLIYAISVPASLAATALPASYLAGHVTAVNISVTLGLVLTATITGGGALWWGWKQRKKASDARKRVKELEGQLRDAHQERDSARRRAEGLERDADRLRKDLEREPEQSAERPEGRRPRGRKQ
jgi:hypothetical protein